MPGHTLVIDGKTYKLSLLPSGVVRPGKLSIIGNGVVVDPWAFVDEVARIRERGVTVTPDCLMVAENAALILPLHRELDSARESSNSVQRLGTTKRGIGPAYEDKVGRRALRVVDLKDPKSLPTKIERLLAHHNALRRGSNLPEIDADALLEALKDIAPKILPFVGSAWRRLDEMRREGKRILFEGAQAVLLDIDHGTYPYVTSSNTVAGQAAAGSGCGPRDIGYVLGIVKAYTTRVGEGPFPTELTDALGEKLGSRGAEFGTVTGRKRRCGWFDSVLVRQTVDHRRHRRHRADETRRARQLRRDQHLHRLSPRRARDRSSTCRRQRAGALRADLRNRRRLERIHARRALLGRTASHSRQIYSPHRRIDRRAGGASFHQPRTRRHDPGARSVRGPIAKGALASLARSLHAKGSLLFLGI